ncbi:MAG: XdhC family protein [Thermocrispum sp.]
MDTSATDPACEQAHGGRADPGADPGTVVAVFDSPVAGYLLHFARECGLGTALLDPRGAATDSRAARYADRVLDGTDPQYLTEATDVVVTDHDRAELGEVLRDVLSGSARWVGVMGSPRHPAPHVPALQRLGVPDDVVARVHRPVGLNIGSRSPAEIALATVAGLIADRRDRPGGFGFG